MDRGGGGQPFFDQVSKRRSFGVFHLLLPCTGAFSRVRPMGEHAAMHRPPSRCRAFVALHRKAGNLFNYSAKSRYWYLFQRDGITNKLVRERLFGGFGRCLLMRRITPSFALRVADLDCFPDRQTYCLRGT
jgi:hypothetical protein